MTRSKGRIRPAIIIACLFVWLPAAGLVWAQTSLIDRGADWRYLDDGSDQGTAWIDPAFDDASWASGPAQLLRGAAGCSCKSTMVRWSRIYLATAIGFACVCPIGPLF